MPLSDQFDSRDPRGDVRGHVAAGRYAVSPVLLGAQPLTATDAIKREQRTRDRELLANIKTFLLRRDIEVLEQQERVLAAAWADREKFRAFQRRYGSIR